MDQYTLRSSLTINHVQLGDNGTYQCIASTVNATTFSIFYLNVYGMHFLFVSSCAHVIVSLFSSPFFYPFFTLYPPIFLPLTSFQILFSFIPSSFPTSSHFPPSNLPLPLSYPSSLTSSSTNTLILFILKCY